MINVPVKAQEPYIKVYADMPPEGYIPGKPEGVVFSVDILIEISGIPDNSPEGIVGWGMTVCFDPDVLEAVKVIGGGPGYLLYDFAGWELPPYYEPMLTIIPPEGGCWNISELIVPIPPGGAGESPYRPNPYPLVTLQFRSKSETVYSPIDLEIVEYMTPDSTWHPVDDVIGGHYNSSLIPETPQEALEKLIETIKNWNLPKGTENSLTSKLEGATHSLNKENDNGAIRKLMAFINRVEMLREKTLTNEQADELVSEAQWIIDLING